MTKTEKTTDKSRFDQLFPQFQRACQTVPFPSSEYLLLLGQLIPLLPTLSLEQMEKIETALDHIPSEPKKATDK